MLTLSYRTDECNKAREEDAASVYGYTSYYY